MLDAAEDVEQSKPGDSEAGHDDQAEKVQQSAVGAPRDLAQNLTKLRQFRHFYVVVVSYIYFTRIVIYLADSTVRTPFLFSFLQTFRVLCSFHKTRRDSVLHMYH